MSTNFQTDQENLQGKKTYRLKFETTDKKLFELIQEAARKCIDMSKEHIDV